MYSQNRMNSNFLIDFSTYFRLSALVYKIHKLCKDNPQIKTKLMCNMNICNNSKQSYQKFQTRMVPRTI